MIVDVPNKSFSIILSNIDCASNEPPASCSNLDSYSLFKVFELLEFHCLKRFLTDSLIVKILEQPYNSSEQPGKFKKKC